jgi:hypothetical protein
MLSKQNNARPIVLRELSLLRALGASRRIFRHPVDQGRSPAPVARVPQPDALGFLPAQTGRRVVPDKGP